jgi:hypothetical protein
MKDVQTERGNPVGNFQHEPIMPQEAHIGYVEGFLDALEKVQSFYERNPNTSIRDICFTLKISMRTTIVSGASGIHIPDDVTSFPSTAQLLRE